MVKRIEFDDADAGAPQEGAIQQEPVVITAEVNGGIITWQPGPHMQDHLQAAAEAGALDEAISGLREALAENIDDIQASVCLAAALSNPEILAELMGQVFVAGGDGIDAFPSFGMPGSMFGESLFGGMPRF